MNQRSTRTPKRNVQSDPDFGVRLEKSEIAGRVRQAVEGAGGPSVVSARSGVPLRTLNNYMDGTSEPKVKNLVLISGATGRSLNWIATGSQDTSIGNENVLAPGITLDEYVFVPRYDVRAAAGGGSIIHSEQIVDFLAFKAEWIRRVLRIHHRHLLLIEAVGDSMEPTITDGDLLLVDTFEPQILDNAIYVLNVSGQLMVKRVQRKLSGNLLVKSDNDRYEPDELSSSEIDQLRVVGRVVWHGGLVR